MEILSCLLNNLKQMDESLIKGDINTALKKVHESIYLIKECESSLDKDNKLAEV